MPEDERRPEPDAMEGVRGSDDENRLRLVVKLFLKLFGGGLGASPVWL